MTAGMNGNVFEERFANQLFARIPPVNCNPERDAKKHETANTQCDLRSMLSLADACFNSKTFEFELFRRLQESQQVRDFLAA